MKKNFLVICLLCGIGVLYPQVVTNFYREADKESMNHWVDSQMSAMTLDEKIGQLFMLVVDPNPRPGTAKIISSHIKNYHVGGILFARGLPADQVASTNIYQSEAKIPLMIALDGEWGLAMRLNGTTQFPKTLSLGAVTDRQLLERYGEEVGRQCREMGIHINFAPALDVIDSLYHPSLRMRSFGHNPEWVSGHANAYARGLERRGVMAVAKHFPGHGHTAEDSHIQTAFVGLSREQLEKSSLYPFRSYINNGFSGIMNGHFCIPALDSVSGLPTSLSAFVTPPLLKKEMGFSGLVFSDALVMKGAETKENVCVLALLAGNDVLVSPPRIQDDFSAVRNAVRNGQIPRSEIDAKCRKILSYKYMFGLNAFHPLEEAGLMSRLNTPFTEELAWRLSVESVTLLKKEKSVFPLEKGEWRNTVVAAFGTPAPNGMKHFPCRNYFQIEKTVDNQSLSSFKQRFPAPEAIICCIYSESVSEKEVLRLIGDNSRYIVCFFIPPYNLGNFKNLIAGSAASLLLYENTVYSHRAAGWILGEGLLPTGQLPVSVKGLQSLENIVF